jgi:hypothetical protein
MGILGSFRFFDMFRENACIPGPDLAKLFSSVKIGSLSELAIAEWACCGLNYNIGVHADA